jgi:regulatory protein
MRAGHPAAPPDEASLHEAALAYLARYAASESGLRRVLERRVERWARSVDRAEASCELGAARLAVNTVVARLVAAGAVDNAAFAQARARRLTRAGRSSRAIAAHLAAKGVDAETVRLTLPANEDAELTAAVAQAARRRIGPFRQKTPDETTRRRELAILARAGFPQSIASRVLGLDHETTEALLHRLRRGDADE